MSEKKSLRDRLAETGPQILRKISDIGPIVVRAVTQTMKSFTDEEQLRQAGVDLARSHEQGR